MKYTITAFNSHQASSESLYRGEYEGGETLGEAFRNFEKFKNGGSIKVLDGRDNFDFSYDYFISDRKSGGAISYELTDPRTYELLEVIAKQEEQIAKLEKQNIIAKEWANDLIMSD